MYLGDFTPGATIRFKFKTADPTAAGSALTSGVVKAYKDGSTTTEVTTGITLTADFDSVTGLNQVAIDTSADGTFYAAGADFCAILTTGTVNGVSIAGEVLAHFSLSNRSAGVALTAAGVRSAVGLASANLDTQLDALPTNAELATALGTADDAVLAAIAALNNLSAAGVRTAVGLGSANLDTQLATIAGYLDTEMAAALAAALAIKLQTDKLTFDGSNQLEVNVKAINDAALTGDGTSGTPWGPA